MTDNEQSHLEIILEDINGKFDLVLEGHATLEHMIQEHRIETRHDKQELLSLIKTSHDSLDAKIANVSTELRTEIANVSTELRTEIANVSAELKTEIRQVGEKVDGHEQRIQYLERKVA